MQLFYFLWLILCWSFLICYCCVLVPKEQCPPAVEKCRCKKYDSTMVCCNITSDFQFRESLNCAKIRQNTLEVHIYNLTLESFKADNLDWAKLKSLSVSGGQIQRIDGQFSGNLSCLNFSQNNISEIHRHAFKNLPHLETLDLSSNMIKNIPNITVSRRNFTLDVSNNSLLWCNSILEVVIRYQNTSRFQFRNRNDTTCLSVRSFHWFNSTDEMTLSQVELLSKGLGEDCPKNCTCRTYRSDLIASHPLSVKLNVNCSNQGLTELPPLPPNTIYLDVSNNFIKSLKPLRMNESYAEVREFIADNNQIESISVLEGSRFINHFAILSLRNNLIKSIPTYILSNAFDRTYHESKIVKIGGNRLECDCSTSKVLKMWLLNNKNYIEDHNEVLCDKVFDRVIDLDPSKVCIYEKSWTDYIYYIIAAEIILLVSLISKVAYDYWVFKSFGYLPWPASRMPKLPCDWCFET